MRKSILRTLSFTAALTMMLTVSASAESATVTGNGVNIRSGPGVSYSVVDCLAKGEIVTVTDRSNDSWYAVNYNGAEGFMSSSYLDITQDEPSGTEAAVSVSVTSSDAYTASENGYINAMYVRFRSGPASSYSVLGEYSKGKSVTINGYTDGWASVTIDGNSGYIYAQYVTEGTPSSENGTSTASVSNGSISAVSVSATADTAVTTEEPAVTAEPAATPAATESAVTSEAAVTVTAADPNSATVTGNDVRFRSGPGSGYSILGTYSKGTVLSILSQLGSGWYEVSIDGTTGYMYGQYISRTDASSASNTAAASSSAQQTTAAATASSAPSGKTGYITGNNVRLRSGPSSMTDVITELYFGNAVTITGSSNGWAAVTYNGQNGYVYGDYVQEGTSVVTSGKVTATVSSSGSSSSTTTATASSSSAKGSDIARFALTLVGSKYCWGGADPSTGFDCSGFVYYVFKQNGYTLNRVAADQASNGTHVDTADLQPGDIICFYSGNNYIGHVGIYIGDGKFVHSSNSSTGVIVSSLSGYYVTRGYEARRIA